MTHDDTMTIRASWIYIVPIIFSRYSSGKPHQLYKKKKNVQTIVKNLLYH